jgi:hypothetical protein
MSAALATQPARRLVTALAAADDAHQQWRDSDASFISYDAAPAEHAAWTQTRDQLLAAIADAERDLAWMLCWKCRGTGRTQWRHRSGGTCFTCAGDGWSAKGRRAYQAGQLG